MSNPRETAYNWHSGQWSPLYSFASTGGKVWSEEHREQLVGEICICLADARKQGLGDEIESLEALLKFVKTTPAQKVRCRFSIGDRVRWSANFCRSIGWYVGIPDNGRVEAIETMGDDIVLVTVRWPNGHADKVNAGNLIPAGHMEAS